MSQRFLYSLVGEDRPIDVYRGNNGGLYVVMLWDYIEYLYGYRCNPYTRGM